MRIPRCAPAWMMAIARDLVKAGADNPGAANVSWIPNWNVALHWIQQPTYSALSYQGDNEVDGAMQKQILDAFARCSQRKLVTVVSQTPVSAIGFFGGAPPNIQLDTFNFEKL